MEKGLDAEIVGTGTNNKHKSVVKINIRPNLIRKLFIPEEIDSKEEVNLQKPLKGPKNPPGANLQGQI